MCFWVEDFGCRKFWSQESKEKIKVSKGPKALEWRWLCAGQALEETLEPSSTVGDTAKGVLGAGMALV